jgi:hypothetical protein
VRLSTIAGTVPELVDLPAGCPFAGRCAFTAQACHHTRPEATLVAQDADGDHLVRCLRPEAMVPAATPAHVVERTARAFPFMTSLPHTPASQAPTAPLLEVTDLVREYTLPRERLLRPPASAGAQGRELRCTAGAAWAWWANPVRANPRWRAP